jgi:hypothetical protein
MTRQEVIEKRAACSRAETRYAWPCIVVSGAVMVAWLFVHTERNDVNLMFFAAIVIPIAAFLIPMARYRKRLGLECPECHALLFKDKNTRLLLETGRCPKCKRRIIDEPR